MEQNERSLEKSKDGKPLKKLYDKAVKNNEETFTYKGCEMFTNYVKYVLELWNIK